MCVLVTTAKCWTEVWVYRTAKGVVTTVAVKKDVGCGVVWREDPEWKLEKKDIYAVVADSYSNEEVEIQDDTNSITVQKMHKNNGRETKNF